MVDLSLSVDFRPLGWFLAERTSRETGADRPNTEKICVSRANLKFGVLSERRSCFAGRQ
jgi:hypothetical protein